MGTAVGATVLPGLLNQLTANLIKGTKLYDGGVCRWQISAAATSAATSSVPRLSLRLSSLFDNNESP